MIDARIFFIVPHYINNSDRFTECDFKDHLYDSAVSTGITGAFFWGDDISYPGLRATPPELARQRLGELRAAILAFKPDVIVFDACFNGNGETVNRDYLRSIKAATGARLFGFMADAWGDRWRDAMGYWDCADKLLYIMPPTPEQLRHPKLLSIAYPCNPANFFPPPAKDIEVSFFGTGYAWRMPYIHAAIETCRANALRYHIQPHERRNDCPDMAGYADILRRSKIVFNLSLRGNGVPIVTGRVWQAINSACLLLEEDNPETAKYFRPGEHYSPFNSPKALQNAIMSAIETWGTNPIPRAGYEFCRQHYSPEIIWRKVLA